MNAPLMSDSELQYSAELALFGKIPVPPRVNPARCEAALVSFSSGRKGSGTRSPKYSSTVPSWGATG